MNHRTIIVQIEGTSMTNFFTKKFVALAILSAAFSSYDMKTCKKLSLSKEKLSLAEEKIRLTEEKIRLTEEKLSLQKIVKS